MFCSMKTVDVFYFEIMIISVKNIRNVHVKINYSAIFNCKIEEFRDDMFKLLLQWLVALPFVHKTFF